MDREEMIKTIRDLVGGKVVFDENWNTRISVGEDRPVCGITKKYIYLGLCYLCSVVVLYALLVHVPGDVPLGKNSFWHLCLVNM
jgi:hypothetical protein